MITDSSASKQLLTIAIDGPAGAGKSTIAKALAHKLGIAYLDTGAMYRSLAWLATQHGISLEDSTALVELLQSGALRVVTSSGGTHILNGDRDITTELYSAEAGRGASLVAQHPEVRREMVAWQQQFAAHQNAVLDGRDIGTTVLPKASLKLFLTASPRVRAERRFKDLQDSGLTLAEIEAELIARDARDINREVAPLRQAEDAVYIDSSERDAAMIIEEIMALLRERGFLGEVVH